MEDKYNLTKEQNIFIAKRNIVDYIWKSANLEGIAVTYPDTQVIYDGGVVNGLAVDDIVVINNLKYAWKFILETDVPYDLNLLYYLHKLVMDKLVPFGDLGKFRSTSVNIGGAKWKPDFPIESKIKKGLDDILSQVDKSKTLIAIDVMLYIMRSQMFIDGNKRVAMLFANKYMIDNGCGIITIANDIQKIFYEKLIKFYESGDVSDLEKWLYDNAIDGIDYNNEEE